MFNPYYLKQALIYLLLTSKTETPVMDTEKKLQEPSEKEIDMGAFFTILSRFFQNIGRAIKLFFLTLFRGVILLLLFIKKKLIWILAGGIAGLAFSLSGFLNSSTKYYSEMIVKPNFESSRLLYQKINNFNSLIRQKRTQDIVQLFDLDNNTASQLKLFSITPIKEPLQIASLYKSTYLDYKRYGAIASDTIWTRTIKYEDFKKMLTDYDYPLHVIRVESGDPNVFPKIQKGIIKSMNENPNFLYAKQMNEKLINEEERIISSSLESLDSLRKAYTKRIEGGISKENADPTNIFLTQPSGRNPEIDLYDKTLLFKDELVTVMKKNIQEKDIIQVYSDFGTQGNRVPRLKNSFINSILIGCVVAFSILLILELFRYLSDIEKKGKIV